MRTITVTAVLVLAAVVAAAQQGPQTNALYRSAGSGEVPKAGRLDPNALDQSCARGKAEDCDSLATIFMRGRDARRDPPRAMRLYKAACDAGHAAACRRLALLHRFASTPKGNTAFRAAGRDPGAPEENERVARALLQRACAGRDGDACAHVARMHRRGDGVARDPEAAAALEEQACRYGALMRCLVAGEVYRQGQSVKRDSRRALAVLELGCERGDPQCCISAGKMYEQGEAGPADPVRAGALLDKAEAQTRALAPTDGATIETPANAQRPVSSR